MKPNPCHPLPILLFITTLVFIAYAPSAAFAQSGAWGPITHELGIGGAVGDVSGCAASTRGSGAPAWGIGGLFLALLLGLRLFALFTAQSRATRCHVVLMLLALGLVFACDHKESSSPNGPTEPVLQDPDVSAGDVFVLGEAPSFDAWVVPGGNLAMSFTALHPGEQMIVGVEVTGGNTGAQAFGFAETFPVESAGGPSPETVSLSGTMSAASGDELELTITATTASGLSDEYVLTLRYNSPVVAVDDDVQTLQNTPVLIDVLDNDEGDPLTIIDLTQPNGGTATIVADEIEYVPDITFTGTDQFEYTISDGRGATDTAVVTIAVDPSWSFTGTFHSYVQNDYIVHDFEVVDFQGIGRLDIGAGITTFSGDGWFVTLDNNSTPGNFDFPNWDSYGCGDFAYGFAAADLNGNGLLDAVCSQVLSNRVTVFFQDPNNPGTFLPGQDISASAGNFVTGGVAIADFSGNSRPDIAVPTTPLGTTGTTEVNVLRNTTPIGSTTASFDRVTVASYPSDQTIDIRTADFNGDGRPDLVFSNNNWNAGKVRVILNETQSPTNVTFSAVYELLTENDRIEGLAVGDLTGNGLPDIVAPGIDGELDYWINTTSVNSPTPSFGPRRSVFTGASSVMKGASIGDLNNDGRNDIVICSWDTETITVFLNLGALDPTTLDLTIADQIQSYGYWPQSSRIADMDGNGVSDVIIGAGGNSGGPMYAIHVMPGQIR